MFWSNQFMEYKFICKVLFSLMFYNKGNIKKLSRMQKIISDTH